MLCELLSLSGTDWILSHKLYTLVRSSIVCVNIMEYTALYYTGVLVYWLIWTITTDWVICKENGLCLTVLEAVKFMIKTYIWWGPYCVPTWRKAKQHIKKRGQGDWPNSHINRKPVPRNTSKSINPFHPSIFFIGLEPSWSNYPFYSFIFDLVTSYEGLFLSQLKSRVLWTGTALLMHLFLPDGIQL